MNRVHDLDYEGVESVCFELTNVLSGKNDLNEVYTEITINNNHINFWAWIGQILKSSDGNPFYDYFSSEEHQLRRLFYHTIRCAIVPGEFENRCILSVSQSEMLHENFGNIGYFSFPLLEGMLRKTCNEFVDYSGKVKKEFTSNSTIYSPTGPGRRRCNSIEDMLYLYRDKIVGDSSKLDQLLKNVSQLASENEHVFRIIYHWRNSSLHGDIQAITIIGGIVLNISLFIILESIKDRYSEYRNRAIRKIEFDPSDPFRFYKQESEVTVNITLGQTSRIQ